MIRQIISQTQWAIKVERLDDSSFDFGEFQQFMLLEDSKLCRGKFEITWKTLDKEAGWVCIEHRAIHILYYIWQFENCICQSIIQLLQNTQQNCHGKSVECYLPKELALRLISSAESRLLPSLTYMYTSSCLANSPKKP